MNASDPQLAGMLRSFARMGDEDRQSVIVELGEAGARRLLPLLEESAVQPYSPTLQALIDTRVNNGLTAKASAAVRKIAAERAPESVGKPASNSGVPTSVFARIGAMLLGG